MFITLDLPYSSDPCLLIDDQHLSHHLIAMCLRVDAESRGPQAKRTIQSSLLEGPDEVGIRIQNDHTLFIHLIVGELTNKQTASVERD